MAVFDHVSSVPSVIFPVDTLQAFFEEKGILFIVDGAHAIGNVNVNIAEINPTLIFLIFINGLFVLRMLLFFIWTITLEI